MIHAEAVQKLYVLIHELAEEGWFLKVANGGLNVVAKTAEAPSFLSNLSKSSRGSICVKCGSSEMVEQGGCETCVNCGESVGGCS